MRCFLNSSPRKLIHPHVLQALTQDISALRTGRPTRCRVQEKIPNNVTSFKGTLMAFWPQALSLCSCLLNQSKENRKKSDF